MDFVDMYRSMRMASSQEDDDEEAEPPEGEEYPGEEGPGPDEGEDGDDDEEDLEDILAADAEEIEVEGPPPAQRRRLGDAPEAMRHFPLVRDDDPPSEAEDLPMHQYGHPGAGDPPGAGAAGPPGVDVPPDPDNENYVFVRLSDMGLEGLSDSEEEYEGVDEKQYCPEDYPFDPAPNKWCFMCEMRQNPSQYASNDRFLSMMRIKAENFVCRAATVWVKSMHKFYHKMLRPILPEGKRCRWKRRTIFEHFVQHESDPLTDALRTEQTLREISRVYSNRVIMRNLHNANDQNVNHQAVKSYLQVTKALTLVGARVQALSAKQGYFHPSGAGLAK